MPTRRAQAAAIGHLGIEFTELGPDHLVGRMPVDGRTRQPFGILHGGASVLFAESLVSCAATFVVAPGKACVGMEINANHLRPVTSGSVTGTARPISLGRRNQVWEVRIVDDDDRLVCFSGARWRWSKRRDPGMSGPTATFAARTRGAADA